MHPKLLYFSSDSEEIDPIGGDISQADKWQPQTWKTISRPRQEWSQAKLPLISTALPSKARVRARPRRGNGC